MQLSLHADFSCRVLIYLATNDAAKSSIDEIASAFHISKNHLVKVVYHLGQLGFIETSRGRGGGICLARPAAEIMIGDVIRKLEPNLDVVECMNLETNTCPIAEVCGLKPWLVKATNAFLHTLDVVTLEDIITNRKGLARTLSISEAVLK